MNRAAVSTAAAILVPAVLFGAYALNSNLINPGQWTTWIAFIAALVSAFGWLAAALGRGEGAEAVGRTAFRIQWGAMLAGTTFLWWILFSHQFTYQYVHDYSSKTMPSHFVFAAFWGGQ